MGDICCLIILQEVHSKDPLEISRIWNISDQTWMEIEKINYTAYQNHGYGMLFNLPDSWMDQRQSPGITRSLRPADLQDLDPRSDKENTFLKCNEHQISSFMKSNVLKVACFLEIW